ncbi:ATP-dependent protease ATP-binding subunit HslU [Helicobacter cinaedi PAGU611]|uniref:ATP-dependent protease ATP-binding subunit n=1 Tax=Helicobacter cinaedi CCUG 18818 = ATCC BAA-847 TaxID=537971 RepID=A0AAI8QFP7_9HELI|nr:HslU--HslV peptidase ATPase subunit [Helicobacter cinaedi]AWK61380.1 HslU--HslV peptidase ATPase subunit [Helicobacter cinaedi]EFR46381.1 ATP-dependent protease HslVU, ATPase subunit [Helicobacter cinaedi CCUG 18818 = ATCC BAA-847]QOQ90035.1 HslU--HslV peptidase ATPase subunit [Helicobacter cinaedi]QOQ96217.1 HslU--HslV peptidase ATPase subunit [Helicobacter cinaedi]BAM11837.1 ATP-dependent protease ATP-binding subunit HslU [Helicobacter cinaedi PAGU611]
MKENMTPKQIVEYLDGYIIGQSEAKKAVAIALRNRYRRMKLDKEVQDEITPKNILMIGSTGVGKTEIARRMAKMMGLPFVKVEASKYTEVGFVGRDVESMVRDLVLASVNLVENEHRQKAQAEINDYIIEKITKKLLPPLPQGASESKQNEYDISFAKMKQKVLKGEVDELKIEIEISKKAQVGDDNLPPDMIKVQESIFKVLNVTNDKVKKEVSVKEAKEALMYEATESVLDSEAIRAEGLKRAESNGVIFIDEIDKVAVGSKDSSRQDPSKEGVQRDLLPIVEGSVVNTKYGQIKTDYILFIAAGAFHFSKPSDLIPELQGRFPLRVELDSLNEESLYKILTQTKSSLLRQYQLLLDTENIRLEFSDEAIREIAKLSHSANERTEDIGARRLHTTIERVLEEISFNIDTYQGKEVTITAEMVKERLGDVVENVDLARYIL